jgi:lysophospholipase L1-like esterase
MARDLVSATRRLPPQRGLGLRVASDDEQRGAHADAIEEVEEARHRRAIDPVAGRPHDPVPREMRVHGVDVHAHVCRRTRHARAPSLTSRTRSRNPAPAAMKALRSIAINLALLIASPILLFGMIEAGLAFLYPQLPRYSGLFRRADENIGAYMARENAVATEFSPEFGEVEVRTNSAGLRDHRDYGPKAADEYRILGLGDSFTWGYGVPYDATFLRRLELRLNGGTDGRIRVVKAGIPGFGTREEYLMLEHYGLAYQPDVVLLAFIGEDMMTNERPNALAQIRQKTSIFDVVHARSLEQLEWQLRDSSHLYNLLISFAGRGPALRWFVRHKAEDSFLLRDYPEHWQRLWETAEGYLDRIRTVLEARGTPLVVLVIPQRIQLLVDRLALEPDRFDARKPGELVAGWAARHDVPVLDLFPRFRDAGARRELYFPIDGHLNADGAGVVAGALFEFLAAHRLTGWTAQAAVQPPELGEGAQDHARVSARGDAAHSRIVVDGSLDDAVAASDQLRQ